MSRKNSNIIISAVLMVGSLMPAEASQVGNVDVSLEALVRMSPLILVVSKNEPPFTVETVQVNGENLPPYAYERKVFHFRVVEELSNRSGVKLKGLLSVRGAHDDAFVAIEQYHKLGLHISSVFQKYRPVSLPEKTNNTFIIFLQTSDTDLPRFSAEGSIEGVSQREKVLQLIRKSLE